MGVELSTGFVGHTVLVSGAGGGPAGGIGFSVARAFAHAGANVMVNDLSDERVEQTVVALQEISATVRGSAGDVSSIADAARIVGETVAQFGGLGILVNNAGIAPSGDSITLSPEVWEKTLKVNLTGAFCLSQAALPVMVERGQGRIINISSLAATRMSLSGSAAYTASKAGMLGMTQHLAVEYARAGVTVNAVQPGPTSTPLLLNRGDASLEESLSRTVPIGRMCRPEDIAAAVLFLASESASAVTGVSVPVDGGMSALPGDYEQFSRQRLN